MHTHAPEHFDGPDEKGKGPNNKTKILSTTVMRVVRGLLDGESEIILGRGKNKKKFNLRKWEQYYRKQDKENSSQSVDSSWREDFAKEYFPDDPDRQRMIREFQIPYTPNTREITKNIVHKATDIMGVDHDKRIRTAIKELGEKYKHISAERFFHRLRNGKLHDDVRFLYGVMYYMKKNPAPNSSIGTILSQGTAHLDKSYVDWRTLEIILSTAKKYFLYHEDALEKELDKLRRKKKVSPGNSSYKAEFTKKEKEIETLKKNLNEYRKWLTSNGRDKKFGNFDGFVSELISIPLRTVPSSKSPQKSKKK